MTVYRTASVPTDRAPEKIPWFRRRPNWWLPFSWVGVRMSDIQDKAVRQKIGGRWVRVRSVPTSLGPSWEWNPVAPPYEGFGTIRWLSRLNDMRRLPRHLWCWWGPSTRMVTVADAYWGEPLEIEDWRRP